MTIELLRINPERFLNTVTDVATIGLLKEEDGGGRDRRPFSPADREAREYFRRAAESSGLDVRLDEAANLSARLACGDSGARTLLIGSHLDTVPHGGAYDGALGVMAGLEVLRVLKENSTTLRHHLEVVDFTDEEGRFGDFFGSRALTGQLSQEQIENFLDSAGAYNADLAAMRAEVPGGLTVEAVPRAWRDPSTLAGYIELHVEQGPRLEHAGVPIAAVSSIFGRRAYLVAFLGRSDHAGTTPLSLRADALVAASHFISGAPRRVQESFPEAVVTCGNVDVRPGVYNVVPNRVTVWVEFRAATQDELDGIKQLLVELAREACQQAERVRALGLEALPGSGTPHRNQENATNGGSAIEQTVGETSRTRPTPMDEGMVTAVRRAAERCGHGSLVLPSGAGHDAMMLAPVTPTGMLFVPSLNGRSHSPEEHTDPDDLVAGANVLLQTVLVLSAE